MIEGLGIEEGRLRQQLAFMVDRAEAHLLASEDKRAWHLAAAASLQRDAASVAILLEEREKAISLLAMAATSYNEAGSTYGATLRALASLARPSHGADEAPWGTAMIYPLLAILTDRAQRRSSIDSGEETVSGQRKVRHPELRETGPEAFEAAAASPYQLLHVLQALILTPGQFPDLGEGLRPLLEAELVDFEALAMPASGTPLGVYRDLLLYDAFDAAPDKGRAWEPAELITGLALNRSLHLQAARRDTYHWRLARNAAELVDLDLMILCVIVGRSPSGKEALNVGFGPRSDLVRLPLDASRWFQVPTDS